MGLVLAAVLMLAPVDGMAVEAEPMPKLLRAPAKAAGIMPIAEVRPGMKGYGLSVFEGVKIEPFAVEVVSVQRDFAPGKSAIWVRCTDDRMQKLGPVAGMSGSPIYLWDVGDPADAANVDKPGVGGRLIGAFAFGYALAKDCYVGVQPIELMREAGARAGDAANQAGADAVRRSPNGRVTQAIMGNLIAGARSAGAGSAAVWRAGIIERAMARPIRGDLRPTNAEDVLPPPPNGHADASAPDLGPGAITRMALPMTMPGDSARRLYELAFMGRAVGAGTMALTAANALRPMQAPMGSGVGQPPSWIEPSKVLLEPGSALSVPLVWGDLDMSAIGTVTDVLPDGRVLAFGHPMLGEGDSSLPVATGYVHYVVPNYLSSFKLGGSVRIAGTLARDESAAVVARADRRYGSAGMAVRVRAPGVPERTYRYQVAHHRQFTALGGAIAALQSSQADQGFPAEFTARLSGTIRFPGQRVLSIDERVSQDNPLSLFIQLLLPVQAMIDNPYQSIAPESYDLSLLIEPEVRRVTIVSARADRRRVQPGGSVGLSVELETWSGAIESRRLTLAIPRDLPDGDYPIAIGAGPSHVELTLAANPQLTVVRGVDDLFHLMTRVFAAHADVLHADLQAADSGLALDRAGLARLPGSRAAVLAPSGAEPAARGPFGGTGSGSSDAAPMSRLISASLPLDSVIQGAAAVQITVSRDADR